MELVKVAAAALNQTPLDWDGNRQNILEAVAQAKKEQVSLLCLPELCLSGYGCEDMFHAPHVARTALKVLEQLLPATDGIAVCLGLPLFYSKAVFNVVALLANRDLVGLVAKQVLAGEGIHYEHRWFSPWPAGTQTTFQFNEKEIPLGDLHFNLNGIKLGFEICEDAWAARRPAQALSSKGVDIIANPSASHFAFGKHETRKRLALDASRAFGVAYIYANLLGNEAGRIIYDGDTLIASQGELLASGPRFSFRNCVLTTATIDLDTIRMNQARNKSVQTDLTNHNSDCINVPFSFPEVTPAKMAAEQETWEEGQHVKEEEFSRAVSLGLFDYLRKSRAKGFVVSLSGGADSSATACLVSIMVKLAVQELGEKLFLEKLHLTSLTNPITELLCCVYQATRNNCPATREAARSLSESLGAQYLEFEIDQLVEKYTEMVSESQPAPLNWKDHDLALQNIQARVRAPGVWLLANLKGSLLLATSNRSEAAVGYATMDGDTCGGLSPIAGIDKAFLLQWLVWLEKAGPSGLEPYSALRAVNSLEPTAELRPLEERQTDEQDLMPYVVLDAIERAAIRDKQSPLGAFHYLCSIFPDYSREQLHLWTIRFFQLWARNQWKRERYAPSFHLDDENLDPKTWCRFPILSGGFDRELALLKQELSGGTADG